MSPTEDLVLLGLDEAAERLGFSRNKTRRLVVEGSLPAIRLVDRWYFRPEHLEAFAKSYVPPRPGRKPGRNQQNRAAIAARLEEWREATADELAVGTGLHVGTVRKHLLMLEKAGLAERDDDALWRPTGQKRLYQEIQPRSA